MDIKTLQPILMKKNRVSLFLYYFFLLFILSGCGTSYKTLEKQTVAQAERRLGIKISKTDPLALFLEAAAWMGTPYRAGGQTKKGADCSGFTSSVYREVYQKQLARSSANIYTQNCIRIRRKSKLKGGDLVFFRTTNSHEITHVGIYLKDNYFIHAATRGGVRVNRLDEPYYHKTFYRSGRVK